MNHLLNLPCEKMGILFPKTRSGHRNKIVVISIRKVKFYSSFVNGSALRTGLGQAFLVFNIWSFFLS